MAKGGQEAKTEMRRRAEEIARSQTAPSSPGQESLSLVETQRTLHELQGQEIELALQNEELREAKAALETSRAFLDSIVEHSPNAMWISDDQGSLLRLNQACRDHLHLRDEEVVGKYNILKDNLIEAQGFMPLVKDVFVKAATARFIISYDSAAVKGIEVAHPTRVVLDVSVSPILDSHGKVTNAVIQHIDMTERRRAEEALRRSESILRAILDHSQEAIGVHVHGIWEMCNPAAVRLFGVPTARELLGTSILEVIAPGERARIRDYIRQRMAGAPAPSAYVTRGLRTGGLEFDMEVSLSDFTLESKRHVLVILRDITARNRAERQKDDAMRFIQTLLAAAPIGILTYKASGPALSANQAAARLVGTTVENLQAQNFRELASWKTSGFLEVAERALAAGQAQLVEQHLMTSFGMEIWVSGQFVPFLHAEEPHLLLLTQDISARKRAEAEMVKLEAQNRRLQKAESLGRMAGAIAHHFNNQLQAVTLNLQMAMNDLPRNAGPVENLAEAMQSARKAAEVSSQMLV